MTKIVAWREAVSCSQMDVATESEIPRFTLFMIESGRQTPTPEQELAIKKALSRILRQRAARFRALLTEEMVQPEQPLQPQLQA
jgi:DNA-binding XRE family transcriptional regulator